MAKIEAIVKEFESLYEDMADLKAEGQTSGFNEKLLVLVSSFKYCKGNLSMALESLSIIFMRFAS